jgi:hypothetical protein
MDGRTIAAPVNTGGSLQVAGREGFFPAPQSKGRPKGIGRFWTEACPQSLAQAVRL